MDHINKLIPGSIRKVGAAGTVKAAMILHACEESLKDQFGEDIASSMHPTIYKNRTVTIRCARSVYAQEIALHEVDVLQRLADRIGPNVVERLRPVS